MLVSPRVRRAVLHLPVRLLPTPTPTSHHKFTRLRLSSHSAMLKQAVASHEAAVQRKALAKQLFSSSPLQQSTPLSNGSANVVRPNAIHSSVNGNGMHAGVKRNASGLAKALSGEDVFEEPQHDLDGTRKSSAATSDEVFFDENDFESDVDLDVEDPAAKGIVSYPKLPAQPSTRLNVGPTLPRQAPHVASSVTHDDYQSIINAQYPPSGNQVDSNPPLPWSSSPPEHFKQPSISQFDYDPLTPIDDAATKTKPSKRRTLPWLSQPQEPEPTAPAHNAESAKSKADKARPSAETFTPLPKNSPKEQYPWNTTASSIKAQQKKLRETNKKLTKTHEATEETKLAANSKKQRDKLHKVFLSEEQCHILELVVEKKKSVFFTGSAGTGKSVLLREIIFALKKISNREPDRVAVTASTGLAACNIGGVTLHSFAGIGLGKEEVPQLVKKIRRNQKARHRWMRTKVLIVDEISMVDGELFDKLEEIARTIRNNGRPFGGIQIVITGDFFQLPPVPDDPRRLAKFCFDASSWNTVVEYTIGLKHIFRQKDPGKTNFPPEK